jgi:hypothetical protein
MNPFSSKKINGLPLFLFRIALGSTLSIVTVFFIKRVILYQKITMYDTNISYFNFIKYPSPTFLLILLLTLLTSTVLMTLGKYFKIACINIFLISLYIFLLHLERFNNHFYLLLLVIGILGFTNADNGLSLKENKEPFIPQWQINLLKFQFIIPYLFSGIQKALDYDWRAGVLIENRLSSLVHHTLLKNINPLALSPILSKIAISFDLLIGFFLLHKKTRVGAVIALIAFHLINHFILYGPIAKESDSVGIFPYIGIVSCILFLDETQISLIASKFHKKIQKAINYFNQSELIQTSKSIFKPYIASLILIFILLIPAYRYMNYQEMYWKDTIIGSWNSHTFFKTGTLNVYYQHNLTGQWILYPPPKSILPPNLKALNSPKGHYALIQYVKSDMESYGLFTRYIGFISEITINNSKQKKFEGILPWEEITKDRFEKEFIKPIPTNN